MSLCTGSDGTVAQPPVQRREHRSLDTGFADTHQVLAVHTTGAGRMLLEYGNS